MKKAEEMAMSKREKLGELFEEAKNMELDKLEDFLKRVDKV